jgi:aminoglycoside phosphotransferase (APT) family kinase protein
MALLNTIDTAAARDQLAVWLPTRLPEATNVTVGEVTIPLSAGLSMTTLLFPASCSIDGATQEFDLVAWVAPESPTIFKDPDLGREAKIIAALAREAVIPVPHVRWVEEDRQWLGAPFMVMDRVYGEVPSEDPPYTMSGWCSRSTRAGAGCSTTTSSTW